MAAPSPLLGHHPELEFTALEELGGWNAHLCQLPAVEDGLLDVYVVGGGVVGLYDEVLTTAVAAAEMDGSPGIERADRPPITHLDRTDFALCHMSRLISTELCNGYLPGHQFRMQSVLPSCRISSIQGRM